MHDDVNKGKLALHLNMSKIQTITTQLTTMCDYLTTPIYCNQKVFYTYYSNAHSTVKSDVN